MSRKDFHGGRSYDAEPPGGGPGFGFGVALAFAWAKLQLARLFGTDGPPEPAAAPRAEPGDGREAMARMFQVIDGPGSSPASLGHRPAAKPMARHIEPRGK